MAVTDDMLKATLLGLEDSAIRVLFTEKYSDQLDDFVRKMAVSFQRWEHLDQTLCTNQDEAGATVSALLYGALNAHVVAMKLLIAGLLVPSGNTQRYCLECLAMTLLCSKPGLGALKRYMAGKYSPNKAVRDVQRHASKLNLFSEAMEQLRTQVKHYDQFSHPSRLSLTSLMLLESSNSGVVLGGAYDKGKEVGYSKEMSSRLSLAGVFPNVILGVAQNWQER